MLRRAGITSYGKRWQLPKLRHLDHLGAIWCISNSDLSFLDISLLRLGYSPLIPHRWKSSLVWISGRNMGSTSSITRVWDIGIVDRLCRLKLDLEAVVEDANEEVYSFQIQRSLIYLKFVRVVQYLILSQNHTKNRLFIRNPS